MNSDRLGTTRRSPPSASAISAPDSLSEGPVKFLLVSGELDDGRWGLVGSYWVSIDGARGGFVVSPRRDLVAAASWSAATRAP